MSEPRVAIVHDYLVQDGGAEVVAAELAQLLPQADLYTSFFDAKRFRDRIDPARVHAWPLNGHFDEQRFRTLLPLYPAYFSSLDLRGYDLVISNSSAFAKAVRTSRRHIHIAYILAPMRFAWQFDEYEEGSSLGLGTRLAGRAMSAPLRTWDRRTSQRPDLMLTISEAVRQRIRRWWGRDAALLYPPVDVAAIPLSAVDEGFLLVAARMLRYRRIDLAVDAATRSGRRLVVVGDGPERHALERRAGPNVSFEGYVPRARLIELFAACSAYLVPGEEDFGIAPIEAMAAGKPVVAIRRGGPAETVIDGQTGVLFDDQSVAGLAAALDRLDTLSFEPAALRANAQRFDRSVFRQSFADVIAGAGFDRSIMRL
jgi:glycosyltransferase involved in cell wall biosynthesis